MKQILGIQIGTEAIGWALIRQSTNPRIVDMGTRVFSSFVSFLGEGEREISSATSRTQIRNKRKVYLRKTYRKKKILLFLAEHGMCPLSAKEVIQWRKDKKHSARSKKMEEWFALNPYLYRSKGVHEKLSKHELGRVLYHMTQRRGKIMTNVHKQSKARILIEGLPTANRLGIQHTEQHLSHNYLGEYLHSLQPVQNTSYSYQEIRIRNRYLKRSMYKKELEALLKQQQRYHKEITPAFLNTLKGKDGNKGIVFYQRPAQYKKSSGSVSTCPFEQNKKSMWQSHPLSEWYDIYTWIDSIRLYGKRLNSIQREKALKVCLHFSGFIFKKVRTAIGVEDSLAFNYDDSTKIYLAHTLSHLARKTAFGERFLDFSEEEQHELWHDLFFYSDKKMLVERLQNRWNLPHHKAKAVASFRLKAGHGKLSMKAARLILPFLIEGHPANNAIIFGGVKNALGTSSWDGWDENTKTSAIQFVEDIIQANKINSPAWLQRFNTSFGVQLNPNKLYLINRHKKEDHLGVTHEEDQAVLRKFKPVAQKPIFELRKLINNIIKEYGALDQINFVLSQEVKVNSKHRKSIYISKKIRERTLPKIHDAVIAEGQNPTHTNLLKYKLWLEWNKTCPYTSTPIAVEQLFTDEVSIVHIHPWKRFFNDSERNKAICMSFFKDNIIDKTPYEYFSEQPSGVWERVKTRVLEQLLNGSGRHASYQKFKHFVVAINAEDTIRQEFNDQHHMAFKVKTYLSRICPHVVAARGNATSSLRRKWGISNPNTVISKGRHLNTREPAVVALVTALNEPKFLEELRFWNRYEPSPYRGVFPTPWTRFTRDALTAYDAISVSIDTNNQVVRKMVQRATGKPNLSPKGKLHKDSYYGKHLTGKSKEESFHIRKPIYSLRTAKQISKIVDQGVREIIYDQVDLCGGFVGGKVPHDSLTKSTDTGWETLVFLPNKNGDPVPVRSVRIREKVGNAVQLIEGKNKYVNPRNNHHVLIYKTVNNHYKEHIVTFWEAVRRIRNNEALYQLPNDGRMIVSTLHTNDCFVLGIDQKEIYRRLHNGISLWDNVYRVQRISSKYYEFRQVYDKDTYDQTYPNYVRILNFGDKKTGWLTHNPFKISIDVLGKISPFYKLLKVPEML